MFQPTHLWQTLPRPIIGLAPMNAVTDHAFRHIQKKHGKPALLFTEFTSADALCFGASALLRDLLYDESQRPIIAQVYGCVPHNFYRAAIVLCQLGFDGIDINMGCPSKSIAQRGAGASLIQTPQLAQEIVAAAQRGARDWLHGATVRQTADIPATLAAQVEARHRRLPAAYQQRRPIPVSVKTRIGYASPQVAEWITRLLATEPDAISLHGRTLAQGYSGTADWDAIGQAALLARGSGTAILGNGDVCSVADAQRRSADYGVDGALIGRASYGNPYVFRTEDGAVHAPCGAPSASHDPDPYALFQIALEHARLFEASFARLEGYQFLPMRKHLGWYVRATPGARHLRRELGLTSSLGEAVAAIERYLAYRRDWEIGEKMEA